MTAGLAEMSGFSAEDFALLGLLPLQPMSAAARQNKHNSRPTIDWFILHLTRFAVERSATAPRVALLLLGNLYEIPAGIVKDGRGDRSHLDGRLSEANAGGHETLVFCVHVLDAKRCKRNPVLHERAFERLGRRAAVRFQYQFHAV